MGEAIDQLAAQAPAGRAATADEIAEAIVFLATDRSSFIYGAKLAVDGGRSRGLNRALAGRETLVIVGGRYLRRAHRRLVDFRRAFPQIDVRLRIGNTRRCQGRA